MQAARRPSFEKHPSGAGGTCPCALPGPPRPGPSSLLQTPGSPGKPPCGKRPALTVAQGLSSGKVGPLGHQLSPHPRGARVRDAPARALHPAPPPAAGTRILTPEPGPGKSGARGNESARVLRAGGTDCKGVGGGVPEAARGPPGRRARDQPRGAAARPLTTRVPWGVQQVPSPARPTSLSGAPWGLRGSPTEAVRRVTGGAGGWIPETRPHLPEAVLHAHSSRHPQIPRAPGREGVGKKGLTVPPTATMSPLGCTATASGS